MTIKHLIKILKTMPPDAFIFYHLSDYSWECGRMPIFYITFEDGEAILMSIKKENP